MQTQRGISLIEVLAAIFVVSVGLLGVLAVIPFGAVQVSQARHADYASNMLINAVQEIAFRELARPSEWGVTTLQSGGTQVFTKADPWDESTLNCQRFLWIESRGMFDADQHIFCIGSTFTPTAQWEEIMRGQDDLLLVPNEDKRPELVIKENKPMSSGKYEWCFSFLPECNVIGVVRGIASRFLTETTDVYRFTVPIDEPALDEDGDPILDGNGDPTTTTVRYSGRLVLSSAQRSTILNAMYTAISGKDLKKNSPFVVRKDYVADLTKMMYDYAVANGSVQIYRNDAWVNYNYSLTDADKSRLNAALVGSVGSREAIGHFASVDVIACYNRAPEGDVQVSNTGFTFLPSSNGGTFTFNNTDCLEALLDTKYVFVTWGTGDVEGGTWCKIVYLEKSQTKPKIIVTSGDIPNVRPNMNVYIPSGVMYHKRVPNMPIW